MSMFTLAVFSARMMASMNQGLEPAPRRGGRFLSGGEVSVPRL